MRKLLIVAALALTSCAPILGSLQGDDAALTRSGNTITFNPGKTPAEDVAVYLNATVLNEKTPPTFTAICKVASGGFGCTLGNIPANQPFTFAVTGATINSGSSTHYRPGSNRPVLTTLKGE